MVNGTINRKDMPLALANPDVYFARNIAGNDGGAIFFKTWDGISTLTNAVIAANEAGGMGGAICMREGNLELTGCGVSENTGGGGGIYIVGAELTAKNVSFTDNWDTVGGAFWSVVIDTGGTLNTSGCKQVGIGGILRLPLGKWVDDPNDPFQYV